jgi:hypothetical protein
MAITITITGSGGAFGIGNISEEQYNYWIDHEDDLVGVFQQDLNQTDIPTDAQIEDHYESFNDIGSTFGLYEDSVNIKILDSKKNVVFDGSYSDFYDSLEQENLDDDLIENHDELYVPFMEDDWGYSVFWRNYQKGTFIDCVISTDSFDPSKLKFSSCDLNGQDTLITSASYEGISLDIDISGMTSNSIEISLHSNI